MLQSNGEIDIDSYGTFQHLHVTKMFIGLSFTHSYTKVSFAGTIYQMDI